MDLSSDVILCVLLHDSWKILQNIKFKNRVAQSNQAFSKEQSKYLTFSMQRYTIYIERIINGFQNLKKSQAKIYQFSFSDLCVIFYNSLCLQYFGM